MKFFFHHVIYHPVRARMFYDVVVTFFTSAFVSIVLISAQLMPFSILISVVVYPFLVPLFALILGMYGRYTLASLPVKICGILCTVFLSFLTGTILSFSIFCSILLLGFSAIFMIVPRLAFFFANHTRKLRFLDTFTEEGQPVLIVGGGGFIGSEVVHQLLSESIPVRVFDKFLYGKAIFDDVKDNPLLEFVEGDMSNVYALTMALQHVRAVVHLAGIVGDPACDVDPFLTRHVNIISTRVLKESVKAFRIPRFIFASSCAVYGVSKKAVNEESAPNPFSLYAQTKLDSENELLQDTFDAFHPTVLRFATVFGHSPRSRFDLVANLFVAQAYYDGQIKVIGKKNMRAFIHVRDVARSIVMTLKAPLPIVSRQIFNVGDESLKLTIGELALVAKKVVPKSKSGKAVNINYLDKITDPRNFDIKFNKIRKTLNFTAKTSVEAGMIEIMQNLKKGIYTHKYSDPIYSNVETTKGLTHEFYSREYQKTHYTALSESSTNEPKLKAAMA